MSLRTLRSAPRRMALATVAGLGLAGQTVQGQQPMPSPATPYQDPRFAQTPQAPSVPIYNDLQGQPVPRPPAPTGGATPYFGPAPGGGAAPAAEAAAPTAPAQPGTGAGANAAGSDFGGYGDAFAAGAFGAGAG